MHYFANTKTVESQLHTLYVRDIRNFVGGSAIEAVERVRIRVCV